MGWRRTFTTNIMQIVRPGEPPYFMPIAWYKAPTGAQTFYGLNAFRQGFEDPENAELPPLLGEQAPHGYPKWSGTNLWGYTGQCRIGTDEQFANGLTAAELAAPPPPIPACCATPRLGQTWFLRHELTPPQSVVPGQILGGWDNQGDPTEAGLLSPMPGSSPFLMIYTRSNFGPGLYTPAIKQYLTAPLPAQTVAAQRWSIQLGEVYGVVPNLGARTCFSLFLIDGGTGAVKQTLIAFRFMGHLWLAGGASTGELLAVAVAQVDVAFGDYLCLEIGFAYGRNIPGAHGNFNAALLDDGTIPISRPLVVNTSPMSLIQWPPSGGDADVPVAGTILPFAGPAVPFGYLLCDGSVQLAVNFPALFAAIGTTWGVGAPGTFALPDLRDRAVIGTSPGALSPTRPSARALAGVGGEETHTLTGAELPAHNHGVTDPGHAHTVTDPGHQHDSSDGNQFVAANGGDFLGAAGPHAAGFIATHTASATTALTVDNAATGVTTNNAGGGGAHNTCMPFAVVQWIIKT